MKELKSLIKENRFYKRFSKSPWYSRFRQYFPMYHCLFIDDRKSVEWQGVQPVIMDWPAKIKKPFIGLICDVGLYPRWTKYIHFFENNGIPFEIFDLYRSDWLEKAVSFDAIIGYHSCSPSYLDQFRRKIFFIEKKLGTVCYPDTFLLNLYEDKRFEYDYCMLNHFPYAKTFITYNKYEALGFINSAKFPLVSKIDPSSGSVAVELIKNRESCRRLINKVFSNQGRKTHFRYFRQKDYVYFQEFILNDGYDFRVEIVGDRAYGYCRKVPEGDFRASGMNLIVTGHLPPEAVVIARKLYKSLQSPMLAVDFVRAIDGKYYIVEFSPFCRIDMPSELQIGDERGAYVFDSDETFHFQKELIWIHDLALQEFFQQEFVKKSML